MNSSTAILRLLAYFAAVLLIACLLSPPLFWLGSSLAEQGTLPFLRNFPFHRYFSRTLQISALLMLIPAFWWVGIRSLRELGLDKNPLWRRDLAAGLGLGFLPVLALAIAYLAFEVYRLRSGFSASGALRILGTASAVAVLEEFLFRGVLLGLCLRVMRPSAAILLSSAVFALVHFLRVAKPTTPVAVEWWSGFAQLPQAFSAAPPWPLLGWGLLSLLLAGIILGLATLRTRSLFLAIAVHAGWILGQQGLQWAAKFSVKPTDSLLPWVGPNIVSGAVPTGLIPTSVMLSTLLALVLYLNHARRQPS